MKFAAFSVVFIDYSIHEAMSMTKELGMDGIEIAGKEPHLSPTTSMVRVREMKKIADDLGIQIPVIASYIGEFSVKSDQECEAAFEEFKQMLERAAALGASMIRAIAGGPNAFLAENYHFEKSAFWLKKCAAEAKKLDLKIVLEIHNGSLTETVESGLRLLQLVDADNVGLIHDAGNMYITDTDYGRDSVLKLGKHMFHVHVKDEKRISELGAPGSFVNLTHRGEEKFLQSCLGEGEADHQPLFDALIETGYNEWMTLECHAPFPPFERLEHDFNVVKRMLGIAIPL